jgi:hypothetical protein
MSRRSWSQKTFVPRALTARKACAHFHPHSRSFFSVSNACHFQALPEYPVDGEDLVSNSGSVPKTSSSSEFITGVWGGPMRVPSDGIGRRLSHGTCVVLKSLTIYSCLWLARLPGASSREGNKAISSCCGLTQLCFKFKK